MPCNESVFQNSTVHLTARYLSFVTDGQEMHLKALLALVLRLTLHGIEGNDADVVSEVVPTQHQASGLRLL